MCNDCGAKFEAQFHVMGLYECPGCHGFNSS